MNRCLSILLAGPSLFALATVAVAQPASPPTPLAESKSADEATKAQQANEKAQASGDEAAIIITARRRAESLLDVPQTVQAVTSKQLKDFNILSFEGISQLVPGISLTAGDTSGAGASASFRGVSFQVRAQSTPTVESYVNEHPVETNALFQDQFDVGQIEVLKGPQGTQRGRSAPSGAMTLTTHRPDLNEIGGSVDMTGTSHGGVHFQAALGVPIIQDVLAVRIAGVVDGNNNGGIDSATSGRNADSRTWAIRGTVRFEPTDNISAVIMGQHMRKHLRSFGGISFGPGIAAVGTAGVTAAVNTAPTAGALSDNLLIPNTALSPSQACATPGVGTCGVLPGGRPRIVSFANFNGPALTAEDRLALQDFPTLNVTTFDVVTAQLDWTFSGQKLSYVGGYSMQHQINGFGGGSDGSNTIVGHQAIPLDVGSDSTEKRITHELRLSSAERLFGMLDYTVGGYYGKTWGPTNFSTFSLWAGAFGSPLGASAVGGPGILSPTTFDVRYGLVSNQFSPRKLIVKAFFGNVIGHLFNVKLELEGGVRQIWYSQERSSLTTFRQGLIAVRNPNGLGACPATLSGVNNANINFINAAVVGSTYPGTCDVQMTLGNGINPSPNDVIGTPRKFSPIVYRLSASFHFTSDLMAYASYGTSWRSGPGPIIGAPNCAAGFSVGFPDPQLCTKYRFLEPETSKGMEIGFKGALFNRRLSFAVAAYKQKFDGLFVVGNGVYLSGQGCIYPHIVNVTVQPGREACAPASGTFTFNAPVKVKGIDADLNFRVSEDLNFGGAASWSTSKFAGGLIPCSDTNFNGQVSDETGATVAALANLNATDYLNRFPGGTGTVVPASAFGASLCDTSATPTLKPSQQPKWNFNVRGEYSHNITPATKAFIRALYNYTPKNKNLAPPSFIPKAYGLLSLFAGVRGDDGSWEISVSGRNILNNKTILSLGAAPGNLTRPPAGDLSQLSFSSNNQSGFTSISFVAQREFSVSARFAFGSR
jgi:iron complex outermembrane receptor protein